MRITKEQPKTKYQTGKCSLVLVSFQLTFDAFKWLHQIGGGALDKTKENYLKAFFSNRYFHFSDKT